MRRVALVALLAAFGLGVIVGRGTGPTAAAQDKGAADPYA